VIATRCRNGAVVVRSLGLDQGWRVWYFPTYAVIFPRPRGGFTHGRQNIPFIRRVKSGRRTARTPSGHERGTMRTRFDRPFIWTPTLREIADELKVNYRTLQSYAAMGTRRPRVREP